MTSCITDKFRLNKFNLVPRVKGLQAIMFPWLIGSFCFFFFQKTKGTFFARSPSIYCENFHNYNLCSHERDRTMTSMLLVRCSTN